MFGFKSLGGGAWPGFGGTPPAVATASSAGSAATASRSNHTHALDVVAYNPSLAGLQASGVLQQTYSAPTATPSVLTMVAGQVPYGAASGVLTQDAFFVRNEGAVRNLTLTALDGGAGFNTKPVLILNHPNVTTTSLRLNIIAGQRNGFEVGRIYIGGTSAGAAGSQNSIVVGFGGITGTPPPVQVFAAQNFSGDYSIWTNTANGDVALGLGIPIATTATAGFVRLPQMAGPPTGVPAYVAPGPGGTRTPFIVEDSGGGGFKLWAYQGSTATWKGVVLA